MQNCDWTRITGLLAYWLIFFWKFLKNPYLLCTSEVASTYFPRWVNIGKGRGIFFDNYYRYPFCVSFLSTFYPFNILTAFLAGKLKLDNAFRVYAYTILIHYFISSALALFMFHQWYGWDVSLYGAILITYFAYNIKPQTPEYIFTMAWVPGMFLGGWFGAVCFGLSLLGGYYPPLIYIIPCVLFLHPEVAFGLILGLPQIAPFLWYYFHSTRFGQVFNKEEGRVSALRLVQLFMPWDSQVPAFGIHYPEVSLYMSILPVLFMWFSDSRAWIPALIALLICLGIIPCIQRIPGRAIYLLSFCIAWMATNGLSHLALPIIPIVFLQAYLLLQNSSIYPSTPFSQWWDRPSKLYSRPYHQDAWPFFTGYLWGGKTSGYKGAFRLA